MKTGSTPACGTEKCLDDSAPQGNRKWPFSVPLVPSKKMEADGRNINSRAEKLSGYSVCSSVLH